MASFGKRSRERLHTCDPRIQELFKEVVKGFDCTVLCGHRDEGKQNDAVREGRSKVRYPDSKHNKTPSKGIDVAPFPVNWNDLNRFYYFAGYVKAKAEALGISIRWGGDWDGDTEVSDQTFMDLPHFEIVEV